MNGPIATAVVVALAYGFGAEIAWLWFGAASFGMAFYPPAGITLAALVLVRRRWWPAVLVGAFLAELTVNELNGLSMWPSVGYGVANCIGPLVGASLLLSRRVLHRSRVRLDRRDHLSWFLCCAVAAGPLVAAVLGALVKATVSDASVAASVGMWWAGDALGVLAVGAPLLVWRNVPALRGRRGELLAAVAVMIAGSGFVYGVLQAVPATVVLPVLVWAAVRLGVRGVASLTPVVAIAANLATASGSVIFDASGLDNMAVTQLWIAAVVLTGWYMAIGVTDRANAERQREVERVRSEQLRVAAHATRLAGCSTVGDLQVAIAEDGGDLLGAMASGVFEVRDGELRARLVRGSGAPPAQEWAPIPLEAPLPFAACARTGEIYSVDDLPTAEAVAPWFAVLAEAAGYQGLVAIPLRTSEGVCGVAAFAFSSPVPLTAAGELDLVTLRDRWSSAMRRVLAQEQELRALEQLARLQRLTADLAAARDRAAISDVVSGAADVLGARVCVLRESSHTVAPTRTTGSSDAGPNPVGSPADPAVHDGHGCVIETEVGPEGELRAKLVAVYCDPTTAAEHQSVLDTAVSLVDQALRRAAVAEVEHTVALALQRSMLGAPDHVPELSVGTMYEAAQFGLEVGGDWYDVINTPTGPLLVIGDVVGHGLRSAAAMGQLRTAVRTLAPTHPQPEELLSRLDEIAATLPGAECTTVAVVAIDLDRQEASYACAGHLPPLLLPADGGAQFLNDGRNVPIACVPERVRESATISFGPGDQLLLYTDGLVERRGTDLDESLQQLRRAADGNRQLTAAEQANRLVHDVRGPDAAEDDIALLIAHFDRNHSNASTAPHIARTRP